VLALRTTDRLANRLLAALIGAVSAMLLLGYLSLRLGFHGHPHFLALGSPLPFLFGPLLYLYIAALTRPIARFDPRFFVHAIPFAAYVLYLLQSFYLKTGDDKLALARASIAGGGPLLFQLMGALRIVQALAYVLASFVVLRRYGRRIEGYFSDLTRIDLRWLLVMVLAHAAVWSIVLASHVVQALGLGGDRVRAFDQAVQIASALAIFLTGYISLWQPELFPRALAARVTEKNEPLPDAQSSVVAPEPMPRVELAQQPAAALPRPKYQRNRIEDAEADELARKLTALMEKDEAYRDAALTLPVLADRVGATPHLLSQVLNVCLGRSFYELVNTYRAEALKAALSDPSRQGSGVLELALEAGFNSKSTLNSFFKKHTGLTPTEFRRRAQVRMTRPGVVASSRELQ
jgi:AraC-like DNA-binding protein